VNSRSEAAPPNPSYHDAATGKQGAEGAGLVGRA